MKVFIVDQNGITKRVLQRKKRQSGLDLNTYTNSIVSFEANPSIIVSRKINLMDSLQAPPHR